MTSGNCQCGLSERPFISQLAGAFIEYYLISMSAFAPLSSLSWVLSVLSGWLTQQQLEHRFGSLSWDVSWYPQAHTHTLTLWLFAKQKHISQYSDSYSVMWMTIFTQLNLMDFFFNFILCVVFSRSRHHKCCGLWREARLCAVSVNMI